MIKEVSGYDDGRTHDIENFGIKIIRFSNDQVNNDIDNVLLGILNIINELAPKQGDRTPFRGQGVKQEGETDNGLKPTKR